MVYAYENRKAQCWSLWQGAQFIATGCSKDELDDFLDIISGGDNRIIYTLKVYDNVDNHRDITDKTPHNGSFNFILGDPYMKAALPPSSDSRKIMELEEKIGALESNLTAPEPEESWKDVFVGLLKEPDALVKLINAGKMILGIAPGPQVQPAYSGNQMGAIGNINESMTRPELTPEQQEQRVHRLAAAIETLDKNDPGIVEHLEKLAEISTRSPGQFSFLVKSLESF